MSGGGHAEDNFSRLFPGMRQNVIAAIQELADEIDTMYDPILKEAKDHVHADECILVYGYSTFVDMFLKGRQEKTLPGYHRRSWSYSRGPQAGSISRC